MSEHPQDSVSVASHNGDANLPADQLVAPISIEINFKSYAVSELTQYGFQIDEALEAEAPDYIYYGPMQLADAVSMDVEFRVRHRGEDSTKCSFCNLRLDQKEALLRVLETASRPTQDEDSITGLSYDQLASGSTPSRSANQADNKPAGAKKSVKSLVVMALGLGMLGILILAAMFMRMQYSLSVSNSALVGNYLPINTKIDGEIAEVFFLEGEEVGQGDVLLRLKNPILESAEALRQAELEASQALVDALKQQIVDFQVKLEVISEKILLELGSTKAELHQSEQNLKIASSEVKQFAPFVKTGAITQVEFDQALSTELAWRADGEAKRAQIKSVELSLRATKNNILVMGDRVDDPLSELRAELKVAEAEVKRLEVEVYYAKQQTKQLEIRAPRDGFLYASYRQTGEYLKPAEEAMALSFPGPAWAIGQISASQVAKARPGQVVQVKIPALDIKTTGTVAAVGHRAVYGRGGYTPDFRSGVATDVPIKVTLDELPAGVPSGIRLDMVVKLELGIPWLDEYMGNVRQPLDKVTSRRPAQESDTLEETQTAGISPR